MPQKALSSGPTARLFVEDLRKFTDSLLERGGQHLPPMLRAGLDASMPILARELEKIPDEVIRDYVRQFADQMYELAAGPVDAPPTPTQRRALELEHELGMDAPPTE